MLEQKRSITVFAVMSEKRMPWVVVAVCGGCLDFDDVDNIAGARPALEELLVAMERLGICAREV